MAALAGLSPPSQANEQAIQTERKMRIQRKCHLPSRTRDWLLATVDRDHAPRSVHRERSAQTASDSRPASDAGTNDYQRTQGAQRYRSSDESHRVDERRAHSAPTDRLVIYLRFEVWRAKASQQRYRCKLRASTKCGTSCATTSDLRAPRLHARGDEHCLLPLSACSLGWGRGQITSAGEQIK